jgi:hypothetical protein
MEATLRLARQPAPTAAWARLATWLHAILAAGSIMFAVKLALSEHRG